MSSLSAVKQMMTKRIIPGKRSFFLLLAAVFMTAGMFLHAGPEEPHKIKYDTASITKREASPDKQKDYEGEDWRYGRDKSAKKSEPTVFDRMWDAFWQRVLDSFTNDDHERSFNPWSILWILILVTIVVLVILKVTDTGLSTIFSGKSKKNTDPDATLEDVDIHGIDYEKQIGQAIDNRDYRLAIRLWFLRTLKTFSDKELLSWKIDKTNSDYYYELSGTNFQQEFGEVSKVYDYIWYGEFPVDEISYSKAEDKFKTLNGKIGS
jgi:hypothetical protein